jgi:exodeoxyribonuclease VII small subunit
MNVHRAFQETIAMTKQKEPQQSFENALKDLEAIVAQMETGQLPLEQSLQAYQRGSELLQFCQKSLADIEQQVRLLNENNTLQTYKDE